MKFKKGMFITFEGIEGSGKTTQIELFCHYLDGEEVQYIRTIEPGGTKIGDEIRRVLLSVEHAEMISLTELLLYAASRAQHVGEKIRPALEEGYVVVCDRFGDSTLAYQGSGRGIDRALIMRLNDICTGGLLPDITFLLDLDVETGMMRNRSANKVDRLELETIEFHRRIREGYHQIARAEPERVRLIKSENSIDAIAQNIQRVFMEVVKQKDYVV